MRNIAKCGNCGDIIESKHRHDFRKCKCGKIFVDGGKEYWRWGIDNSVAGNLLPDSSTFIRLNEKLEEVKEGV